MCTALRRVRGTLLSRGPWVMDGQLLLGTRPALQRQTQTQMHKHHCTERQRQGEVLQPEGAADIKTSTVAWCLRKWRKIQEKSDWEHSDLSWVYNSTCVFLEVRVWFWHSAPSPLLPLVHCYKAQRRCSGWVSHTHTHTHITRHPSATQCHESHHCSGWIQYMSIMIELTWWIQLCVTELPPVRQMYTQTCRQKISKQWSWFALQQ